MSIKSYIKDFLARREAKKVICAKCLSYDKNDSYELCRHPKRKKEKKDYISGKTIVRYYSCDSYNINGCCHLFQKKPTITKLEEIKEEEQI